VDSETFKRWVRPWLAAFSFFIPPTYPGAWFVWRDSRIGRPARADEADTPGSSPRP